MEAKNSVNNFVLSKTLNIFKKLILVHLVLLTFMSLFRVVFFLNYNPLDSFDNYYMDILNAFLLGVRLDLTVVGYIQALPTLLLMFIYYFKKEILLDLFNSFLKYYLFVCYLIVTILLCADFGFYSYFKDHINIIFFGLLDDDTKALIITMWENYNVVLILSIFFIYLYGLYKIIKTILYKKDTSINSFIGLKISFIIFVIFIVLNFLAIRGTLGMYPLGKMIPNVSEHEFINKVSQNGFRAFTTAYGIRKKYLKHEYDLIKETGFKNNIKKAFQIHTGNKNIDETNLLNNITYKTKKIDDKEYNVVVIMVESFGMPILKYNSEKFNILGNLKKHFDEDVLFTNFISSGDGTISSLESLLLNIPNRPNSFAISQSNYKQTSFTYSPAFLYKNANYETSFIYGGDLSWRNLGKFIGFQGYDNTEGKINIYKNILNKDKDEDEYFHEWGIYDEHLYSHILKKLEKSDKKQFILALSTNNHPPYSVPNDYKKKNLQFSDELEKHIIGDRNLAQQRFGSYQYAVNSLGIFLDKFKKTKYANNTIVVITADNNTIDGIMKYDDNKLFNSKNIPLYFYLPQSLKQKLKIDVSVAGSHKDIFPTLYNLTLNETSFLSVGNNLFDTMQKHYGFNSSMIINHNEDIKKLNSLKQKTSDEDLDYYKSSLAITQYLIDAIYKKNN